MQRIASTEAWEETSGTRELSKGFIVAVGLKERKRENVCHVKKASYIKKSRCILLKKLCFPYIFIYYWGWHVYVNHLIQLGFLNPLGERDYLYQNCLESFAFRYMFNFIILDVLMISQNHLTIFDFPIPFHVLQLTIPKSLLISPFEMCMSHTYQLISSHAIVK